MTLPNLNHYVLPEVTTNLGLNNGLNCNHLFFKINIANRCGSMVMALHLFCQHMTL